MALRVATTGDRQASPCPLSRSSATEAGFPLPAGLGRWWYGRTRREMPEAASLEAGQTPGTARAL